MGVWVLLYLTHYATRRAVAGCGNTGAHTGAAAMLPTHAQLTAFLFLCAQKKNLYFFILKILEVQKTVAMRTHDEGLTFAYGRTWVVIDVVREGFG